MKKLVFSICLSLLSITFSVAQDTYDWDASAPDGNFKQGAAGCRWSKNGGSGGCYWDEPGYGIVKLNNNTHTTMTNNATGWSTFRMEFLSSANNTRTIGGNAVKFFDFSNNIPAILNNSATTHNINFAIEIGNNSASTSPQYGFEINAYSGALNIGGNISAENSTTSPKTLVLMSNFSGSGTSPIAVTGNITNGSGTVALLKKDNNTATLSGANTYTGTTTVSGGTLIFGRTGGTTIPNSNNVVINGGNLKISTNQTVNDLTLTSGTLTIDSNITLTINGSFTGGGTIENNGKLILNGPSSFPGASTIISAMTNLEINRSGGITLDKGITITGVLTLTDGTFSLGNNNLKLTATATIAGTPTSTNMIITNGTGEVRKEFTTTGSFLFPIGTTGRYTPVTLDFTSGSFSSAYAAAKTTNAKHASNSSSTDYINRYWELSQSGISSFSCNITCKYHDNDIVGTESNLYCGKYSGGVWTAASATNTSTNELVFANATSFSDITGGELTALPVSLLQFTAQSDLKGNNTIQWTTATEINCAQFELQKSNNQNDFQTIYTSTCSGFSNAIKEYSYIDYNTAVTPAYYMLKQIDFDGKTEYFGPIKIESVNNISAIEIFPNPTKQTVVVRPNGLISDAPLTVTITTLTGLVMQQIEMYTPIAFNLDLSSYNPGMYLINFTQNNQSTFRKIQKL